MSIELKIKSKHLSLEAGVIRFEENKLKKQIKWFRRHLMPCNHLESKLYSLSNHRKLDVRNENRATFLARAFISKKSYKSIENTVKDKNKLISVIVPRVVAMVRRYNTYNIKDTDIIDWINN